MTPTLEKALNRLAKWRSVLTGWQLGTRPSEDPECQAVRDHRELSIMLRVELNALTALIRNEVPDFDAKFEKHLLEEAAIMEQGFEERFPGASATDHGIQLDGRAAEWMSKFRP